MRYAYKPEISPDPEKDWFRKTWDGNQEVLCYEDADVLQLTHVIVNNAAIQTWKPFLELEERDVFTCLPRSNHCCRTELPDK